jgi:hypothetical protein
MNTFNKQLWTVNKGRSSRLGEVLTTPHCKNLTLQQISQGLGLVTSSGKGAWDLEHAI